MFVFLCSEYATQGQMKQMAQKRCVHTAFICCHAFYCPSCNDACVLLLMLFYLTISLTISLLMNVYNNSIKLKER